ncbi:hypothetical protein GCM10009429_23560 [Dyella marensis]
MSVSLLSEYADWRDGARYRFLCANPDWTFIEKLCRAVVADSAIDFKRALDEQIDKCIRSQTSPGSV